MSINGTVSNDFSSIFLKIYIFNLDAEFVKVDGTDLSHRVSTIDSQGKFLTLWMSPATNIHDETIDLLPLQSMSNPSASSITSDSGLNSNLESSSSASTVSEGSSDPDTISDIYLTLLHSTTKNHLQIEQHHTVNSLASNIIWPTIVSQTEQHNRKSTTNNSLKQLPSTSKSKRIQPYTKT